MNETLYDGLIVMCLGMGTVLCFLCILIFAMGVMSKVVLYLNKIFPEAVTVLPTAKKKVACADDACALAILTAFLRNKK